MLSTFKYRLEARGITIVLYMCLLLVVVLVVLFYGLCAKWLFVLWKICDVLWECELMCVGLLRSCDLYIEWLAFDLWLMVIRTFLYMSYRRVCRMRFERTWLVCEFNLIVTPIWTFWLYIQLTKTKFNFVVSSNKQITFFTIICFYLFFFLFRFIRVGY